jgi:hypothetical protein
MSYSAITSDEVQAGKPVTSSLLTKVKDNFTDHETRMVDLENGSAVDYPPIIMRVNGAYSSVLGVAVNYLKTTCNFNLRVTGVRLIIDTAGSSGTTEIDIKYSRAGGAYTSILTTKPSVASSAGSDATSSNAVINNTHRDLQAGDMIRLDVTSVQTGGYSFMVRIDYTKI